MGLPLLVDVLQRRQPATQPLRSARLPGLCRSCQRLWSLWSLWSRWSRWSLGSFDRCRLCERLWIRWIRWIRWSNGGFGGVGILRDGRVRIDAAERIGDGREPRPAERNGELEPGAGVLGRAWEGRERQLLQRSPEYEQLAKNNPLMAQMMANPEMLRQSLSPQNLRLMRELERSGALQGMRAGMGWGQTAGVGAPMLSSEQIRQKYANEVSQIEAMGFTVDDNLLQTLNRFQGNVEMTLNFLLQ